MKTNTFSPELLHKMDAYWRAANYLSVGQIYLYDNPLLKRPLTLADVKHMPPEHFTRGACCSLLPWALLTPALGAVLMSTSKVIVAINARLLRLMK